MEPRSASPTLRRRLWRTGAAVVGGSVFASACFAHLSFVQFGTIDYTGTMIAASLIPLIVASAAFGWIASLTLRLDASRRELERLALQDPLTGLSNRRAAMAQLDAWSGETEALALAIADIDFFKRVNDRLGHDGGDASLIHFAAMLRRMLPAGWLVARIGGEEFLIAAQTSDFTQFSGTIETLRRTVAETPLITSAGPYNLTASFGLAERRIAGGRDAEPTDRLITRADMALYAAKQAGRNRIEKAA
ncbi:MAG: GGDEF domain-containing protein [Porphyrobacter sp.]|nr:GGDEF domain-containing protein [Porphyrobacter sp.]